MLHLRAHSVYSYAKALAYVEDIADEMKSQGENSFAICDIDSCTGFIKAHKAAKRRKMKMIHAIDMPVLPEEEYDANKVQSLLSDELRRSGLKRISDEERAEAEKTVNELKNRKTAETFYVTLVARTKNGLNNLIKLYNLSKPLYDGATKYAVTKEDVLQNSDGLLLVLWDESDVAFYLSLHDEKNGTNVDKRAEIALQQWQDAFGTNMFVQLDLTTEQGFFRFMHDEHDVKAIAAHDCRYVKESQRMDWRIFRNVLNPEERITHFDDHLHMLTELEYRNLLPDWADVYVDEALEELKTVDTMIEDIQFPRAAPLKDRSKELLELCQKGWETIRKGTKYEEASLKRYQYELDVINGKGFSEYFIKVLDIIKTGHDLGVISGPARGSGGGSEVCYLIGITKLDPLQYDLYFERFLNPGRPGYPDIDTDFAATPLLDESRSIVETPVGTFQWYDSVQTVNGENVTMKEVWENVQNEKSIQLQQNVTLNAENTHLKSRKEQLYERYGTLSSREMIMKELVHRGVFNFAGFIQNEIRATTLVLFKSVAKWVGMPFAEQVHITKEYGDKLAEKVYSGWLKDACETLGYPYQDNWEVVERYMPFCYRWNKVPFNNGTAASGVIMIEGETNIPVRNDTVMYNGEDLESYGYIKFDILTVSTLDMLQYFNGLDFQWEPEKWVQFCELGAVPMSGTVVLSDGSRIAVPLALKRLEDGEELDVSELEG